MKRSLGIAVMLMSALLVSAQTAPEPASKTDMAGCEAMMQQHQAMQKQMSDMDARLQALVTDMNAATGQAKVDKMAAVINELVAQRAAMKTQMARMQPEMMHHMMEHSQGGKDAMADCPMMKEGKAAMHQHK